MTQNNSEAIRAANLQIYGVLAAAAATLAGVGMISNSVNNAVATLPQTTVAGLATSLPVMAVSVCGFASFGLIGAAVVFVIWRSPRAAAHRQQRDDDEPRIIASPRPAQIATPTIRQLPPPMTPNEPRFAAYRGDIANAVQREQQRATYDDDVPENPEIATFTSDYGYQPQYADDAPETPTHAPQGPEPPPIATNQRIVARLGNGEDISISTAAWLAFASLQKPNRDDWRLSLKASGNSSPNADYGKCKAIADQYHLLSGAGVWISPKMRDNVTQWLTQP